MGSFIDLSVTFRWSRDAAADLIPLLVGFCDPARLGPFASNGPVAVRAQALTPGEYLSSSFDGYSTIERQVDDWFREGNGGLFEIRNYPTTSALFTASLARFGTGSDFGSLQLWLTDDQRHGSPGFARDLTDLLAQACGLVPVYRGGCSGQHQTMFGTYGLIANPKKTLQISDDVIVDHDWQIVIPPAAAAKLDVEHLKLVASRGEVRQVDWGNGRVGVVARACDDPSAMTHLQWGEWREALKPALVEHKRAVSERSDPAPPHVDTADWTVMTDDEREAKLDRRLRQSHSLRAADLRSSANFKLNFPSRMPSVEPSAAAIRELMARPDAPYQSGYGLRSLAATPESFADHEKWVFDRPLSAETRTFLTTEMPVPWNPGTIEYSRAEPPELFGRVLLWSDGSRGVADLLVYSEPRETAPIVRSVDEGEWGLIFPSLRSALWLWTLCLKHGFDVFDSPDDEGWETLQDVWWYAGGGEPFGYLPEAMQGPIAEGFRWLIDVETQAGCLRGLDLAELIACGQESKAWPADWDSDTGLSN